MRAVSIEEAVAMIPAGASIMVGGFMGVGTPERLLHEIVRQQKSGLSLISNDAAMAKAMVSGRSYAAARPRRRRPRCRRCVDTLHARASTEPETSRDKVLANLRKDASASRR